MKELLMILAVFVSSGAAVGFFRLYEMKDAYFHFQMFEKKYHKTYESDAERDRHYRIFRESLKKINAQRLKYRWTANQYNIDETSDWDAEDFKTKTRETTTEKDIQKKHPFRYPSHGSWG